MTSTLCALVAVVLIGLGLVRPLGWWRRRRGAAKVDAQAIQREARAVDLRVLLFRTRRFLGMRPGRPHPVRADLLLTGDRFLMPSDRGVLADITRTRGRRFTSVRCTGPHRLLIEGHIPPHGRYRFEIAVPDAEAWVDALAPYTEHDTPFGSYRGDGP